MKREAAKTIREMAKTFALPEKGVKRIFDSLSPEEKQLHLRKMRKAISVNQQARLNQLIENRARTR